MISSSFFNKLKDSIYKNYGQDQGKMLIHTGVIGWGLSAAAQVLALICNDKISKKDKMYMIPQEVADACVNVLSFYIVTQSFNTIAKQLVKTGKWLPALTAKYLKNNNIKDVGKSTFSVLENVKLPAKELNEYTKFSHGMDVGSTLIGAILSCNILTPLIRNQIATSRQKTMLSKTPIDNTKSKEYTYLAKTTNFKAFQNGNLKI